MWYELLIGVVVIVGTNIVYTRMEAVSKEITHILTMFAMVGIIVSVSAENQALTKQLKERHQQVKIELVLPDGADPEQLRTKLAELSLTLNSEVSSGLLRQISESLKALWSLIKSMMWDHLEEPAAPHSIPPFYAESELMDPPYNRAHTIRWLIDKCGGVFPFSTSFSVPLKTVQDWHKGRRLPRVYVIRLFQIAILCAKKHEHIKKYAPNIGAEILKCMY